MNSEDRNSIIRHVCGGILIIAIIIFYPVSLLIRALT